MIAFIEDYKSHRDICWRSSPGDMDIRQGSHSGKLGIFLQHPAESLMNFNRARGHREGRYAPVAALKGGPALSPELEIFHIGHKLSQQEHT